MLSTIASGAMRDSTLLIASMSKGSKQPATIVLYLVRDSPTVVARLRAKGSLTAKLCRYQKRSFSCSVEKGFAILPVPRRFARGPLSSIDQLRVRGAAQKFGPS